MTNKSRIITMPLQLEQAIKAQTMPQIKDVSEYSEENFLGLLEEVMKSIELQEDCDELFTLGLAALEDYEYDEAFRYATIVAQETDNLEQQIAAMHLMSIAMEKNDIATDAFLRVIYK